MDTVFNSRLTLCRAPLGAVAGGERVRFRAFPESWRFPLRGYLVAEFEASGETRELRMTRLGSSCGREVFEAELDTRGYVGLVFYHFRFENDGGFFRYGAREGRTGGECEFYGAETARPFQLTVYRKREAPGWFGDGVCYQIFPDRFAVGENLNEKTVKENPDGFPPHSFPSGLSEQDGRSAAGASSGSPARSADELFHSETISDASEQNVPRETIPDDLLCDGTTLTDRARILKPWDGEPNPHAERFEGRNVVTNRDFFGGNLAGVREKLDYLRSLGVTTIYLNPIFEAFSNHRYDTGDYEKIDPLLGSEDDFRALCGAAHERGMKIILDGVFNHTGSDSRYFNRRGTYPTIGAFQSKLSPYYEWYTFAHWPGEYESWWGMDNLPAVRETKSFREYVCERVVKRWTAAGADGWRLDVADEISDEFIREIAAAARSVKPDAFVVGEVWEDASNKISYSRRRRYLLDGGLDAATGYVFRTALLNLLDGGDAETFRDELEDMFENYPPYAIHNSMNILGTHDTPRILTLLGAPEGAFDGAKESHGAVRCAPENRPRAVKLLKIASAIQYFLPGCPTVYYGDEAGLEGAEDPFCRRTYPWGCEDAELLAWYRLLGRARGELAALKSDEPLAFERAEGTALLLRRGGTACDDVAMTADQSPQAGTLDRKSPREPSPADQPPRAALLAVNLGGEPCAFSLPDGDYRDFATRERVRGAVKVEALGVRLLVGENVPRGTTFHVEQSEARESAGTAKAPSDRVPDKNVPRGTICSAAPRSREARDAI